MKLLLVVVGVAFLGAAVVFGMLSHSPDASVTLINVSYDPTRELYRELSQKFAESYRAQTGQSVTVQTSHGGSGAQARAVLGGLPADLVTLALASDIEALEERGLIRPGWQDRFPAQSLPYTSTILFLVRRGNPKGIRTWSDLVRGDVSVITPNPKTSGGARWNFLAAWGSVTQGGGSEEQATAFVRKLYEHVPVLDTGARGATTTFVQKNIGDVLLAWENEAILALREMGDGSLDLVYPETSIRAEPPVAVVDRVVDEKGTRAAAEAFLRYLYTEPAQEAIARWGFRPQNPDVLGRHAKTLPPIARLFTLKDVAGTWKEAQKKFFADGGVFDRIYQPR